MSTPPRRRFQRLALAAPGVLLVVVGGSRLARAVGRWFQDRTAHSAEVVVDRSSADRPATASRPGAVLYDRSFTVRRGGSLDLDLGSETETVRTLSGDRARVTVEGRGRDTEREFERRRFSAR